MEKRYKFGKERDVPVHHLVQHNGIDSKCAGCSELSERVHQSHSTEDFDRKESKRETQTRET
jgi:hypothetical protein